MCVSASYDSEAAERGQQRLATLQTALHTEVAASCDSERVEQQGPDMHFHDNGEKKGIGERKIV